MHTIDISKVKTYPIADRSNLVTLRDMVKVDAPLIPFDDIQMERVCQAIIEALENKCPVIWMMGAHVIKSGLSLFLVDLLKRGIVTHVAGNGAVSIHDFELALIGETSEDVATSLEDGTFGMAHETGSLMHRALREGVQDGLGYGASIGRFISINPELFPYRDVSILYNAYKLKIPVTIHVTIGADIIHQHPDASFTMIGTASGRDFISFISTVSTLEGGVFLNFGSAVTGPEVFLKSLTIARNLGHATSHITTANFDLLPVPKLDHPMSYDEPLYYYRPLKNIVLRPTSLGGQGYHIIGDHKMTIPNLHHRLISANNTQAPVTKEFIADVDQKETTVCVEKTLSKKITAIIDNLTTRQPALSVITQDLYQAFYALTQCFLAGGTLYICGNGGSMSDALHISGELLKSYTLPRQLPMHRIKALLNQPDGEILVRNLESGLRTVVLGVNTALSTAIGNDMVDRNMGFAQELFALARSGDMLLGISTSGQARNVIYAAQTARALGLSVISLTGESGGTLAGLADIALRTPSDSTDRTQEYHVLSYHALCEMLEVYFYSENS